MPRHLTLITLAAAVLALAGCHKPAPAKSDAERARAVSVGVVAARAITGALAASRLAALAPAPLSLMSWSSSRA